MIKARGTTLEAVRLLVVFLVLLLTVLSLIDVVWMPELSLKCLVLGCFLETEVCQGCRTMLTLCTPARAGPFFTNPPCIPGCWRGLRPQAILWCGTGVEGPVHQELCRAPSWHTGHPHHGRPVSSQPLSHVEPNRLRVHREIADASWS